MEHAVKKITFKSYFQFSKWYNLFKAAYTLSFLHKFKNRWKRWWLYLCRKFSSSL